MKKYLVIFIVLLLFVCSGCTTNEPEPENKEFVTVYFSGSCESTSIQIEKGTAIGDPSTLPLKFQDLADNESVAGYYYFEAETFETFDMSQPIQEDTCIIVERQLCAVAIPVPDDGSGIIEVDSIDVPCAKYQANGTRYKICLKPNQTIQLDTVVLPENATDKSITYTFDNNSGIATVSETGLVTGVKYGTDMLRPWASNGVNIGIVVLVLGYDMNINIPNQASCYYLCDTIDYEANIHYYAMGRVDELYELPLEAKLEIVKGDDLLSYDPTTRTLTVSASPETEQEVTFRFVVTDLVGSDYSNEITVKIGKTVN